MEREAYLKAREEAERELSGETIDIDGVCPDCGVIGGRTVPIEFNDDPDIWKSAGYPVVICLSCILRRTPRAGNQSQE